MRAALALALLLGSLIPASSWSAEVILTHASTAAPGEIVPITVFGDPMGAIDIAYRIELGVTEGSLSVVSTTTPAPFTPTQFSGTCGIVTVDGCIASDGISQPFANTFAATDLATLELDTAGLAPGTVVFVRVSSTGFDFFGADRPLQKTVTIEGAPAVPTLPGPAALLLAALLLAGVAALLLPRRALR